MYDLLLVCYLAPFSRYLKLTLNNIATLTFNSSSFKIVPFEIIPPAFDAPVGGFHRNIAIMFGTGKLEWCGYPTVNKFEDMFSRFNIISGCERHRQTD